MLLFNAIINHANIIYDSNQVFIECIDVMMSF